MIMKKLLLLSLIVSVTGTVLADDDLECKETPQIESILPAGDWTLVFQDEFAGSEKDLDANWEFQNGPSGHILCSRWRENAELADGTLKMNAKKEDRGGQHWTAASLWTKKKFLYGYYECRYRYAAATGTNNSFWLMTRDHDEARKLGVNNVNEVPGRFEIDINEGHYPNEINMNIHNWTGKHWSRSKHISIDGAELARDFHVYGLKWTADELVWYYDGKEIRREKNTICHKATHVWLSLAIMNWAGPVTDAVDGASMEVDYVRIYKAADE